MIEEFMVPQVRPWLHPSLAVLVRRNWTCVLRQYLKVYLDSVYHWCLRTRSNEFSGHGGHLGWEPEPVFSLRPPSPWAVSRGRYCTSWRHMSFTTGLVTAAARGVAVETQQDKVSTQKCSSSKYLFSVILMIAWVPLAQTLTTPWAPGSFLTLLAEWVVEFSVPFPTLV